jgi:squalene-hopene/tetraprenyl-beta-curcumene cyclase
MSINPARLDNAYQLALEALLAERMPAGHWTGELSTSALSTATAVMALSLVQQRTHRAGEFDARIAGGLDWLARHQNADGGWGDTVKSFSNISTTMLCRAAFHLGGGLSRYALVIQRADLWMNERHGTTPEEHAEAVRARYGKDRTFSVPILTTCALAGLVAWKEVPRLPFELAAFPQSWFRFLTLQVVSYALPALIAIGQCVHHHRPPWNPLTRLTRWLTRRRTLRVLEHIQPSNGGFLEATPLTSFVTLSLASIGQGDHPVARKGVQFILDSVRPDGSWPIDTNLATWVTTLAVNALAGAGDLPRLDRREALCDWLLAQQFQQRHPYTGAEPGGWSWDPLPGAVPDADDTPGALLALAHLLAGATPIDDFIRGTIGPVKLIELDNSWTRKLKYPDVRQYPGFQVLLGLWWLLRLQNRDGGWPTFCRGWGTLPFDRSGTDLTAHALRALSVWRKQLLASSVANAFTDVFSLSVYVDGIRARFPSGRALDAAIQRGFAYLARSQRVDGSWLPLWFGNQHAPDDENPTYGTARVLAAYRDLERMRDEPAQRAVRWLLDVQNTDGGWGGAKNTPSSIEETALALDVLLEAGSDSLLAVERGLDWLIEQVEAGKLHEPTPIGFYFAKLWYFEKMYPLVTSVAALGRARRLRGLA